MSKNYKIVVPKAGADDESGTSIRLYALDEIVVVDICFKLLSEGATNERAPEPSVFNSWLAEPSDVGKVKLLIVVALIAHLPLPSNVIASPDALFDRIESTNILLILCIS